MRATSTAGEVGKAAAQAAAAATVAALAAFDGHNSMRTLPEGADRGLRTEATCLPNSGEWVQGQEREGEGGTMPMLAKFLMPLTHN